MAKAKRIGSFSIPRSFIEDHEQAVRDCLSGLIVVKAEMSFAEDAINYVAIGWPFPKMAREQRYSVPLLNVIAKFEQDEDGSVHFNGWEQS